MNAGLDCRDLATALAHRPQQCDRLPGMLPSDPLHRPKSRFRDRAFRRTSRNPAEPQLLDAGRISRAEERPDVVKAANVVQNDADGKRPDVLVQRARRGRLERDAVHRARKYSTTTRCYTETSR